MKKLLEWYVYYHNWNDNEIKPFNVFRHGSFLADCKKNARKNIHDYDAFCEKLKTDAMSYFWSRCEWEILLMPWIKRKGNDDYSEKIDVFDQLQLNWDAFCKYAWEHGIELRRREKHNA